MRNLFFETYRVGMMRKNMEEIEPIVRNADILTVDLSAVRRADAPGSLHSTVNGFYGEEICQLVQFAGISNKMTLFGLFEFDPLIDYNNQTAQLASQMIWYFIEGYLHRIKHNEFADSNSYIRHSIQVSDYTQDLIFYCHKITHQWWTIVPIINMEKDTEHSYFLPCSLKDFENACANIIPERWWRTYHKLNR
jgi:hypothetical protein